MFGLVFSTDQLLGTTPQLNQVCQVGLQLLKKETKFYEKYESTNACYDLFHLASLSLTFCPAQRIPTKSFLARTQVYELPTGFPRFSPSPANAVFYMFLILQLKPALGVISLHHQPFIGPNYNQNTEPIII
jgi:hypothetical protein